MPQREGPVCHGGERSHGSRVMRKPHTVSSVLAFCSLGFQLTRCGPFTLRGEIRNYSDMDSISLPSPHRNNQNNV